MAAPEGKMRKKSTGITVPFREMPIQSNRALLWLRETLNISSFCGEPAQRFSTEFIYKPLSLH